MKQFCNAGKGMCWKSKCCFVSVDIKCVWYRLWRIDTLWLNIAAQLLPVLLLAIVLLAVSYLITFFDNELFLNAAVICGICITVNVRFFFFLEMSELRDYLPVYSYTITCSQLFSWSNSKKPQWLALLSSVCLTISLVYNFLSEE